MLWILALLEIVILQVRTLTCGKFVVLIGCLCAPEALPQGTTSVILYQLKLECRYMTIVVGATVNSKQTICIRSVLHNEAGVHPVIIVKMKSRINNCLFIHR